MVKTDVVEASIVSDTADSSRWNKPPDVPPPPPVAPAEVELFMSPSFQGVRERVGPRTAQLLAQAERQRRQTIVLLSVLTLGVAIALGAGVMYFAHRPGPVGRVALDPIPDQTIDELAALSIAVPRQAELHPGQQLRFALIDPAAGMKIDESTGRFTWTPAESQGPRDYTVTVAALVDDRPVAERQFRIAVRERNRPPQIAAIPEQKCVAERTLSFEIKARDPDQPPRELRFELLDGAPPDAELDPLTGRFSWTPTTDDRSTYRVNFAVHEVGSDRLVSHSAFTIHVVSGAGKSDLARGDEQRSMPPRRTASSNTTLEGEGTAVKAAKAPGDDELVALYRERKLLNPKTYPALRKIMADRFVREHEAGIKQGLGADAAKMQEWFDAHRDIYEELLIAIDAEHDRIPAVFTLFNELRENFERVLADYGELAIATAVVWDDEGVVNNLEGLANRAKAAVPSDRLTALENFRYLVDAEPWMQGRVQFSPWEFLTHVVNNKTPRDEREWALEAYLARRPMIGKCYHDVPYDSLMLKSHSAQARLNGQRYTLPNLLQFGGVCTYQADYASRVAKCLGVPAESVGGTALDGEGHAWVMWVELSHITRDNIGFTLQSHGRYRSHRYYVGRLRDPQSGQEISDRQLELRLHVVGDNVQNKRHADLVMRAYPTIAAQAELTPKLRWEFLSATLALCPGNEAAWHAATQLAKEHAGEKEFEKYVTAALDEMFKTFAAFPDFTWEIFDDLVSYDPNIRTRMELHARLLKMYERASRPDLASKACLKLVDYLVEDKRQPEAIAGLAYSIKAFPDEGTIVPALLDRLESLCGDSDAAKAELAQFYAEFLPLVPPMLDDRPSPYCMKMLERGIDRFKKAGQGDLAQSAELQLARLKELDKPLMQ